MVSTIHDTLQDLDLAITGRDGGGWVVVVACKDVVSWDCSSWLHGLVLGGVMMRGCLHLQPRPVLSDIN